MSSQNVAIITTCNRCELLRRCIACVRKQEGANCDILVIDNHSQDGTVEYLRTQHDVMVCYMTENTGGAGGFYTGMKLAYEAGYERLWLMDDDVMPAPDALARLLAAGEQLQGAFGFLYSEVQWLDGSICRMNEPKSLRGLVTTAGLIPLQQASFVSVLFTAAIVAKVGLPIPEFFIWGDDVEYTRRIAVRAGLLGYWVHESHVTHMTPQNFGSSIAVDVPERIERYVYAYRNERYLYRQEGLSGITYYWLKCMLNLWRILIFGRGLKKRRLCALLRGIRQGKRFNPQVRWPDESRRQERVQGIAHVGR